MPLRALIIAHGHCPDCGFPVQDDLHECECQLERRLALIPKIEKLLNDHGDDKKALHKASKQLLSYPYSRDELESLIQSWRRRRPDAIAKFEVTFEHWTEIDKQEKLDRQKIYWKTASGNRAKSKSEAEGVFTKSDIVDIWHLQQGACYFCGVPLKTPTEKHPFHIDHIVPLSLGGDEWPDNLALLCQHCNNVKHVKSENEYWHICESVHGKELIERQKAKAKIIRPVRLKLGKARRKAVNEKI